MTTPPNYLPPAGSTIPSPAHALTLRALVSSREAGIIIGRGGQTIQRIRTEADVRIRLSEAVPRCSERVLTVVGLPDQLAQAMGLVALQLLSTTDQQDQEQQQQQQQQQEQQLEQNLLTLKLLIPHAQMGAIIGKAGAMIQDIQSRTQSRLIASEAVLFNSTDRSVSISGSVDQVTAAVREIAWILAPYYQSDARGEPRGHVNYQPGVHSRPHRSSAAGPSSFMAEASFSPSTSGQPPAMMSTTGDMAGSGQQSQHISVPNDMVGAIIGRAGNKINEIRVKSGAQIRIHEAPKDALERTVTITGSNESIKMALYLLYGRLEHEKRKLLHQQQDVEMEEQQQQQQQQDVQQEY